MHRQTEQRETRLLELVPDPRATEVVAVVAGEGNARLFRSLGATQIVEGGQSMNPSTADILAAIEATAAPEVIVLPNNSNVILSRRAGGRARRRSRCGSCRRARSRPGSRRWSPTTRPRAAEENAAEMEEAVAAVATGAVTTASRDVELDGLAVEKGAYLGLLEGEPVAGGADFDEVAAAVVERLLAEPRERADDPHRRGRARAERPARPHRGAAPGPRGRGPGRRPAALPPAALRRVASSRVPIRVVRRSRTTTSSGRRSRCCSTLRGDIEVVGSEADGERRRRALRASSRRTCSLVDYRLPGLDGVQVTRLVREHCPEVAVVALTAAAEEREIEALLEAGAVACIGKDRAARRDRRRGRAAARSRRRLMELTAENTAIVLDSTADFPDGPERFPNWRVVPLYVRFGDESFRDYVELGPHEFYERLRERRRAADDLAADARRLPRDLRGARRRTSGSSRCTSREALGHGRERAAAPARSSAAARCARSTPGRSRPGSRCSRSPSSERLERGTTDEEIDALVERFRRESRLVFTVDTLEFLAKGGRIGKAAAMAGTLLNIKPILGDRGRRGRPAEARPRRAQGVPRVRRGVRAGSVDRPSLRVGIAHADAPERLEALRELVRRTRPQAQIEVETTLGAVVGTHAGPGAVGFFWFDDSD